MIDIYSLLNENKEINDWKVYSEVTESYELFFVHKKLETVRATDTENVTVTVYADHDGKRGHASFKIFASTTENEAREKIAAAAEKASFISNEFYTLPGEEKFEGKIPSNFEEYSKEELAEKISRAVFSSDMLSHGSLNALEVFINKHKISVKNSLGIDKTETKYSAMLEAIPTWNEGESVELYEASHFNSLDEEKIKKEIENKMREVRDRGRATKPSESLSCPVLIPALELSSLFYSLVFGLNYANVYAHHNPYSEGDAIQKAPKNDKINITLKGVIDGVVLSALFDEDGTTLVDTEVIRDGVAVGYFGGNRFAQYLGKAPTGNLSCMEVKTGTLTEKELSSRPYFECVSMSGLQVDVYNDYIGGEVRLAYYFDGEKKIPLTGISISGKLSDALNSVKLSEKCEKTGRYSGPEYALFEGITIV